MNINLVVLGGINNDKGVLSDFTKKRIIKCYKMLDDLKDRNINIHFSGGFNENFNKTNVSHSQLCVNYFEELNKNNYTIEKEQHTNNNNTVDEAINFGKHFQNLTSEIKIITSDWHLDRVKYLFKKTFDFYEIKNYEFISVNSDVLDNVRINDEKNKVKQLEENPYGTWKEWLDNN